MRILLGVLTVWVMGTMAAQGLTAYSKLTDPGQLPEYLKIQVKPSKDDDKVMKVSIEFVAVKPEGFELSVHARAHLSIVLEGETMGRIYLDDSFKDGVYRFSFELSRRAFDESKLDLSSFMTDAKGLGIIGGGVRYEILLNGFLPLE